MNWILFRRETDNVHYFWNGDYVICVWVPLGMSINNEIWNMGERDLAILKTASVKPTRVLKFVGEKARYIIVTKGEFTGE